MYVPITPFLHMELFPCIRYMWALSFPNQFLFGRTHLVTQKHRTVLIEIISMAVMQG